MIITWNLKPLFLSVRFNRKMKNRLLFRESLFFEVKNVGEKIGILNFYYFCGTLV